MTTSDLIAKDTSGRDNHLSSKDAGKGFEAAGREPRAAGRGTSAACDGSRVVELEAENQRLRQLVVELLVRNQQVRELSSVSPRGKGLV